MDERMWGCKQMCTSKLFRVSLRRSRCLKHLIIDTFRLEFEVALARRKQKVSVRCMWAGNVITRQKRPYSRTTCMECSRITLYEVHPLQQLKLGKQFELDDTYVIESRENHFFSYILKINIRPAAWIIRLNPHFQNNFDNKTLPSEPHHKSKWKGHLQWNWFLKIMYFPQTYFFHIAPYLSTNKSG